MSVLDRRSSASDPDALPRCLVCGRAPSTLADGSWLWRTLGFCRVGPFCQEACAARVLITEDPTFTLAQWQALRFSQWLLRGGSPEDCVPVPAAELVLGPPD